MQSSFSSLRAFVIARLHEPSTYVGLGLLAVSLGAPASKVNSILQIGGYILGGSLVSVSEASTK